jgi:WXG100 family type VII secretion target
MSLIVINTDGLEQISKKLEKSINEIQQKNDALEDLINEMEGTWDGESSLMYVSMMRSSLKRMRKVETLLRTFKKYVDEVITRFGNSDKKSASKINSAF